MQFSIRQMMLVTAYVAVGLWAVSSFMPLGLIFPTILGGAMANRASRRFGAIVFGIFCANTVGIVSILATRWVLFQFYPEQLYPLQDDGWRNLVIRIWALSGLFGGMVGSVSAYLVLCGSRRLATTPHTDETNLGDLVSK